MAFTSLEVEQLEKLFKQNQYFGDISNPYYFQHVSGSLPVLISAPHATHYMLDGKQVPAATYTGALALLLKKYTNAHIIYRTKYSTHTRTSDDMLNYKETIRTLHKQYRYKLFIELMTPSSHEYDLSLTLPSIPPSFTTSPEFINEVLYAHGILDFSVTSYGLHDFTSYTSQTLRIPSIQFRPSKMYRLPSGDFFSFQMFVDSLMEIIRSVHKKA